MGDGSDWAKPCIILTYPSPFEGFSMCVAEMHSLEVFNWEESLLHLWQHLQDLTAVQAIIIRIIIKRNNILWYISVCLL